MPTIIAIPRNLNADMTTPGAPAIPFLAGSVLSLNISLQGVSPSSSVTVFLACTALNGTQACTLALDTIIQSYTGVITVPPGTTNVITDIVTQASITPGLLLLVDITAIDGTEIGCAKELFQVTN